MRSRRPSRPAAVGGAKATGTRTHRTLDLVYSRAQSVANRRPGNSNPHQGFKLPGKPHVHYSGYYSSNRPVSGFASRPVPVGCPVPFRVHARIATPAPVTPRCEIKSRRDLGVRAGCRVMSAVGTVTPPCPQGAVPAQGHRYCHPPVPQATMCVGGKPVRSPNTQRHIPMPTNTNCSMSDAVQQGCRIAPACRNNHNQNKSKS